MLDSPVGTTPVSEFHIQAEIYKARPKINSVLLRAHGIVLASEDVKCLLIDGIHFDENALACLEASRLGPPIAMSDEELDIFQNRFSRSNHGRKLWHYYSTRAIENGVLPEEWRDAV